jgi:hypothetical protein
MHLCYLFSSIVFTMLEPTIATTSNYHMFTSSRDLMLVKHSHVSLFLLESSSSMQKQKIHQEVGGLLSLSFRHFPDRDIAGNALVCCLFVWLPIHTPGNHKSVCLFVWLPTHTLINLPASY